MTPAQEFSGILREVLGDTSKFIPLHEPCFRGEESKLVQDCITSGWVSRVGKYVDQFEVNLAEFCGVKRAIAVVNGTAALHICLILAGVQSGDEVIMPSLTFVASANAANVVGANPHFVDVERSTLGIDPEKLDDHLQMIAEVKAGGVYNRRTGRKIAAIVPMHAFGHSVRLNELMAVCEKWAIPMVEDAAESLGSYYQGKHTGGFGIAAAVSFNGNKIMTTGGGGAILTNDESLADHAKHLTTTAKVAHPWDFVHDERGFNYRMPNLNAALGVAQLKQVPKFLKAKRNLAQNYKKAFGACSWLRWVDEPDGCQSNFWLCSVEIEPSHVKEMEDILKYSNELGLMTRPLWKPMHQLKIYANCERSEMTITEALASRVISIPSGVELGSYLE